MCGINGILGLNNPQAAAEKVQAMNQAMRHRGPDDAGIFTDDRIALGHRRLSIIDLSAAGHQPMASVDGRYQIVYNGELYNYKELKLELQRVASGSSNKAYLFQTNTDTEVILAAFIRWGELCVNYFNGMFAFAIWDTEKKELFVARDRLGIKPLYYFYTKGIFAFSSEIRSLLASQIIPKQIDRSGLVDYLRYQTVHAPNTILKGVKMLLPGHFMLASATEVNMKSYWTLAKNTESLSKGKTYEQVCLDVNNLLTRAVERRLVADVPFGAFLSGGIDSSAVVGMMAKVSSGKIKTFSVNFAEEEFSEAKYARMIAKKFNTDHHEINLTPGDFLNELPGALNAMDHPSGDGPNTYVVSKATKAAGVSMALSGLGGDELFAGYAVFKRAQDLMKRKFIQQLPGIVRKAGAGTLTMLKPGISSEKIAAWLRSEKADVDSFYTISRQVLLDKQLRELLVDETLPDNEVGKICAGFKSFDKKHLLSKISVSEMTTYMQNVLLRDSDQMSMAHALEIRVPFLDYTLVEYVLGLPDEFKSTVSPKKLLVDALGDLLPPEVVNRPKMGFTFPWKNWMKNELKSFCEERMQSLSRRKWFHEKAVLQLWHGFLKNDPRVSWSRIWMLVVLENWMLENDINE